MDEAYERALEVNEEVVYLVCSYQETQDSSVLLQVYQLLHGVTMQEIASVLRKSGLPKDLSSDMAQDAYLKLCDACLYYNYARCPVFITYWRTSLKRHLIDLYQKRWRHFSVEPDLHPDLKTETVSNNLDDVRNKLVNEFSGWGDKWKKQSALVIRILKDRIMKDDSDSDKPSQKQLAQEYGITQCQVSNWERWVRSKIIPEISDDLYNQA